MYLTATLPALSRRWWASEKRNWWMAIRWKVVLRIYCKFILCGTTAESTSLTNTTHSLIFHSCIHPSTKVAPVLLPVRWNWVGSRSGSFSDSPTKVKDATLWFTTLGIIGCRPDLQQIYRGGMQNIQHNRERGECGEMEREERGSADMIVVDDSQRRICRSGWTILLIIIYFISFFTIGFNGHNG